MLFHRIRMMNRTGVTFFTARYRGFNEIEGVVQALPQPGMLPDPVVIFMNLPPDGDAENGPIEPVEGVRRVDLDLMPFPDRPGGIAGWPIVVPDQRRTIRAIDVMLERDMVAGHFRAVAVATFHDGTQLEYPTFFP